ncbi:MAG TPA: PAS domain-containing sensor histidine kinase [Candidatus Saccharimonadales bacterium]|nr:PAS domain-containing sensor histidine kinase [Candidatus Saccharimonadales bacterium]
MAKINPSLDLRERVRWYGKMRWFYLLPLAVAGLLPIYLSQGLSQDFRRQSSVAIIGIVLNLIILLSTSRRFHIRNKLFYLVLAVVQIAFDMSLATWLLYENGGIESRSVIIYAIPIIMTGALLGRLATYWAATTSSILYVGLISLDHYKLIKPPNAIFGFAHTDFLFYLRSTIFYTAIFIVLAIITDYVGRLIREGERLESEMKGLSAEKAKIEAMLKTLGSAILAIDTEGKIVMVNDAFENLTGWKESEVLGVKLGEIMPLYDEKGQRIQESERPVMRLLNNFVKGGKPVVEHYSDYYLPRKDGTRFPVIGAIAPIVLRGQIIGITSVIDDATAAKEMQQLKNNFVALASHQLKTPVGEIQGYADNMLAGITGPLNEQQTKYLQSIHEVTVRCNKLITDLLDIEVIERGNTALDVRPVELSKVIKKVVEIYQERVKQKNIKLEVKHAQPIVVEADSDKLVEIISNVVTNAVSYTKYGSTITIETKQDAEFGTVLVTDQGEGMSQKVIDSIFQKNDILSAAPEAEGGTGIGLYLAKELLALQKGKISVVSSSSRGTIMSIKIPLGGKRHGR